MDAKAIGAEIARDFFRRRGVIMLDGKSLAALVAGALDRREDARERYLAGDAAGDLAAAIDGARAAFYAIAAEAHS